MRRQACSMSVWPGFLSNSQEPGSGNMGTIHARGPPSHCYIATCNQHRADHLRKTGTIGDRDIFFQGGGNVRRHVIATQVPEESAARRRNAEIFGEMRHPQTPIYTYIGICTYTYTRVPRIRGPFLGVL